MTDVREVAGETFRLPGGGLIDRRRPLTFEFDGRRYRGYAGDTLAAALLAAGVRLIGRSFKYHRPRGTLTAGSEEPNALVELRSGARREPNTRATTAEVFDGLEARSQNRWPSLALDVRAISNLLSPMLPTGFYYKTFMWPAAFWEKLYEPAIRRAAGLGRASFEPDPDTYEKAWAFCDVLIVGGGPAGLSAALAAGRSGARVILCDEDFVLGGRLNAERCAIDGVSGSAWAARAQSELSEMPEVRLLRRTTVFGAYDGSTFGAIERVADHLYEPPRHQPRQRLWKIVAKRVVLAAGAVEQPLVFDGNDRPGVMMASAVRTYLNRFGVLPGRRAVVFTSSDDAWKTAFDLAAAGAAVSAIIDARAELPPALMETAMRTGIRTLRAAQVLRTHGGRALRSVTVRDERGRLERIEADLLCMSGGWSPSMALATHLGARPRWRDDLVSFVAGELPATSAAAGAVRGSLSLGDALRQGAAAGREAATSAGYAGPGPAALTVDEERTGWSPGWRFAPAHGKAFVDFQNDVTVGDIALATREGFTSVEHLKRYTTLGMGTDQGKTSNVSGLGILAALTGRAIAALGTTTSRPPYTPVAIGALAGLHRGRHFKPTRLTPSHDWASQRGATFVETGNWLRARWFRAAGETDWLQTVTREVKAVRSSVGVCDVTTLGKIDIQGPDAATFLDRVYINLFSTLPVGKVRYGLMLREDGFALDDGTTAHIAPGHYLMSTTTANALKVMQHLEFARQVLWPELDVQIVSITEQWAQYAIAGPDSRRVLQALLGDALEVSNEAFPYLACADFSWCGLPARLFRISFSGELAYELAVPARYGDATIRAIMSAGEKYGIVPYGTEALGVMRVEKGHIAGNEINGTTTAADLGLGRMMSTKKDFIGRVLAGRVGLTAVDRPVLVGLKPVNGTECLRAGAHLLAQGAAVGLRNDQGYVTSVAFSPAVDSWIGLALLTRGAERHGERIRACDPLRGCEIGVEVAAPAFFDPQGSRLQR